MRSIKYKNRFNIEQQVQQQDWNETVTNYLELRTELGLISLKLNLRMTNQIPNPMEKIYCIFANIESMINRKILLKL